MRSAWIGLLCLAPTLLACTAASAQATETAEPFRPYRFVLLAFGAGWLVIGFWIFRVGSRAARLAEEVEARTEGEESA
ncbi:MAG: hypothetical protein PVI57_13530 [Gemmatimonadota bacterium]|jgi:hypothetical protein